MSQSFFTKLDLNEKESRLHQLAHSKTEVTVWVKGQKDKFKFNVVEFYKEKMELVLGSREDFLPTGSLVLCSFEMRGMSFFSQVTLGRSNTDKVLLKFQDSLFKSERRSSFRLLTYPIYEVYAEFDVEEAYEGGKVISLKAKLSQTSLFKNFLKLVDNRTDEKLHQTIKYRVQDLSVTGMSLHIGDLDSKYFSKGLSYKDVVLYFIDEKIVIPEVKVVYVVDYVSSDKNLKKYKTGIQFPNLPTTIDTQLGKKINSLLREVDSNKDFENFVK